ncbi:MAG: hypothetical protein EPN30_08375 [Actinomycetota bacterium]|nr:MAG: hypothetical protein EPN30_08375 [Actinomycetota bacterium]
MGIRIPGSKSRAERVEPSVPPADFPTDVSLARKDAQLDVKLDAAQPNTKREAEAPLPAADLASTRASRAWTRILPALLLLAVILVFVFQNLDNTRITFITFSGTVPAALALIVAAALGGLFVLTIGSIRIIQLRKVLHMRR